jgi:ring-1,2-phenylacetyl-CoA epoxidase subunit PaaE
MVLTYKLFYFCTMNEFHTLRVTDVRKETQDCVSIALETERLRKCQTSFDFKAGQYLTLKAADRGGGSAPELFFVQCSERFGELRVAVKRVEQGQVQHLGEWTSSRKADTLESMAPNGKFVLDIQPTHPKRKFLAFAAGSGITPVLSQIQEVLQQ